MMGDVKEDLIQQVLDIELESWNKIHQGQNNETPEGFLRVRKSMFRTWSMGTLQSYFKDLSKYKMTRMNIMFLKYARIDNRIPPLNDSDLIPKIVEVEARWQDEISQKYPKLFRNNSNESFKKYLSAELETYSADTLQGYYSDIAEAAVKKVNLAEERYLGMFKDLGFSTLEEANSAAK